MSLLKPFLLLFIAGLGSLAFGQTLSQSYNVNYYRDVDSRNLEGLATRSDGRIVLGPTLRQLSGEIPTDIVWDLEPVGPASWLAPSGPNGEILQVGLSADDLSFTATPWAELEANQVLVIKQVSGGRILAGTSPAGRLLLLSPDATELASVTLPADSVLDIVLLPEPGHVLVATGNPGRIYQVDTEKLAGIAADDDEDATLEDRGVTLWGEIRDRNVRSLARDASTGEIWAGSSPSANVYLFPASGGAPRIMLDLEKGEVIDLHRHTDGNLYIAVSESGTAAKNRIINTASIDAETTADDDKEDNATAAPTIMEAALSSGFEGRSSLYRIESPGGLPELVASRANVAFYQIASHENLLLLPSGDAGDFLAYDPDTRRSLTLPGSSAAQLTRLVPWPNDANRRLLLTNNPVGLEQVSFSAAGPRSVRTKRLDLRSPGKVGALRFDRVRGISFGDVQVEMRANLGRDELEGWSAWHHAAGNDGGWQVPDLWGQFVEVRITLPEDAPAGTELDKGDIYHLPRNRRPVLQRFNLVSPNFGLVERTANATTQPPTLGQVIGTTKRSGDDNDSNRHLNNLVTPQPGAQIVTWTLRDPDGDNVRAEFAIRHEDEDEWRILAADTAESWVQFDRRSLREGLYFTRLRVHETAPRPENERRSVSFETDDLLIDLTPPEIAAVSFAGSADGLNVAVTLQDTHARVAGLTLRFNNGFEQELAQPMDGILDGRTEDFAVTLSRDLLRAATAVEIVVRDVAGNEAGHRYQLPAE